MVAVVMVCLVVMMMQVAGLGVVTALELKELILCWTWFLTRTPFMKPL